MAELKRQFRIHLLPPTHKDYGKDIPLEDDERDQPEILRTTPFDPVINDFHLVEAYHWSHEVIERTPDPWKWKILLLRGVNNQIQNEMMDPEGKHARPERRQPSDMDIASARAMFPQMSVDDARRWLGGDDDRAATTAETAHY